MTQVTCPNESERHTGIADANGFCFGCGELTERVDLQMMLRQSDGTTRWVAPDPARIRVWRARMAREIAAYAEAQ